MKNLLIEASPIDPATNLPVTVRMSCAGADVSGVIINGYSWLPLITSGPKFSVKIFGDGQVQPTTISYGDIVFNLPTALGVDVWSTYNWDGAYARIFVGDLGAAFGSYRQIFEGRTGPLDREYSTARVALLGPDSDLDFDILTSVYQGTGNAEGDASLKGKLKPRAFGNCQNVAPVLLDPAFWIFQVNDGAINDVTMVYENAYQIAASPTATVSTYAELKALTLAPGQWAKAPGAGMFRLGGQPSGKVTADVQGALRSSDNAYVTTLSTILPVVLKVAGLADAKIDQASFNAFSGYTWSLYQTDQDTVGNVVREALAQAQGYLIPSSTGVFRAGSYFGSRTPIALSQSRSAIPLVRSIKQPVSAPPNYRVKIGAERCWTTHSDSEISSAIKDAGQAAEAATAAAIAANDNANQAYANAVAATARLAAIDDDSILDRSEKASVIAEFQKATAEKAGINTTATGLGITTENTTYNNAYTALSNYLSGLSPAYTLTTADTPIVRTTWTTRWVDFYVARQDLQNKIAQVTATTANWSGVTGSGKPQDNATNGATAGVNLKDALGAVLADNAIKNQAITVDSNGNLVNIGTIGVPVDNSKQLWQHVKGPGRPADFATSDISLVSMSGTNVAIEGNRVSRANTSGTNFPDGAFASKVAQPASCTLEWVPNAAGQSAICGMGIATSQVAPAGNLANVNFWFGTVYANGWTIRVPGQTNVNSSTPFTTGDIFRIHYDGNDVVFKINDTTVHTVRNIAANQTFYAVGSCADVAATIERIRWTPFTDRTWDNIRGKFRPADSAGTNLTLVSGGNNSATLTFPGNAIVKAGASSSSWAFSRESYVDGATVSFTGQWNGTTYPGSTVVGMSSTHPNNIPSGAGTAGPYITFAFLLNGTSVGIWAGGGNSAWWPTTATGNEQFEIRYDGTQVQWFINGAVVYTSTNASVVQPSLRMYLVADVGIQGGGAKDILFSGTSVRPKCGATMWSGGGALLTDSGIITSQGIAAGFTGAGSLATLNNVNWASHVVGRPGNLAALAGTEELRNNLITINSNGILNGGGGGAVTFGGLGGGAVGQLPEVYFGHPLLKESAGGLAATLANFRTSLGIAAGFVGAGSGATANNLAQLNASEGNKLAGIAAGATVGADWASNLANRPGNLAAINATEGNKLASVEANADVTANSQHSIVASVSTIDFAADYQNVLLTGQLSKTVAIKRFRGTTDVSSSTTWSASATAGISGSISANGQLSFTAVANGAVAITGTYQGVPMQCAITITRSVGAAPVGGGAGASSASTTVIGPATSTGYFTGVSNTLTLACGSSGQIGLTTTLDFYIEGTQPYDQNQGCYGKWQWRPVGGSWADVAGEVVSSWSAFVPAQNQYQQPTIDADLQSQNGHIDVNQIKSGLSSGSNYEFRFAWRLSAGGPVLYGNGSFYAAQI